MLMRRSENLLLSDKTGMNSGRQFLKLCRSIEMEMSIVQLVRAGRRIHHPR